ncbi:rRNA maturation RNase YbeY [Ahniella affigens]|uniref:Endoribonuclease YbeY n=1 Tax=Ahniella affigens TaxID=2021234 RepID=A0A2P1PRA1_9GAMM|nr:rRNA maturation RNase YbeY [Ahniella affigens]AVP97348.1 rRNA maturation RNase YbeY [Ahniella affigens]
MSSPIVHLDVQVPKRGLPTRSDIESWVQAALRVARRRKPTELSIQILDREPAQAFNRDYRGRDYATNVLSFPVELPPGVKTPLIGDLVICAPVMADEAKAQGKALKQHFAHLCIHGVLHLLGYDHIEDADAEIMEALEIKALATLGIPNPYE